MSVARAQSEIDSREFVAWLAYYQIEAESQRDSMLAATGKRGKRYDNSAESAEALRAAARMRRGA